MRKLLTIILISLSGFTYAQTPVYEIIKNPKVEQAFTQENIDSLEVKILQLRHQTETVYYEVSEWTTVKIYPIIQKLNAIKEEQ